MTQRRLLTVCTVALAIALAGNHTHALAQNSNESKDSGSNAAESNPNENQGTTSSNSKTDSAANNSNSNSSSNNSQASGSQPSQSDAQENQNNAAPNEKSDSSDRGSNQGTANNTQDRDDQTARDQQKKTESQAKDDANRDQDRNADGSTSKNEGRDSDRADSDRSNPDNRNADTRRDFRRDFKFGQSNNRGLVVSTIVRDSIFYRSGLRNGDIIVSYNGQRIRNQDDFGRIVLYEPGRRVPVVVYRDGREETIYVVYEDNGRATSPAGSNSLFGADFDPQSRDGAVIIRVQNGGPADRAGLQQNDLVVALNGEQVKDGRQATETVHRMQSGDRVEVEYMRHTQTHVTLGGGGAVSDTRFYRGEDRGRSVATGVDTDQTRRDNSARDRNDNNRNRRDDRRDDGQRRGILPRLRN